MTKNNRPMWIAFGAAMALSVAFGVFVGCGDGFAGSHVFLPSCETEPLNEYITDYCLEDCFDNYQPYCEEFCAVDSTLPWCGPGTGGTGGTAGTGGVAGAGGTAGTGGVGGQGGTGGTTPECIYHWQCIDLNHCTIDRCVEGQCESSPREAGVYCFEDGEYGFCDGAGECNPICACGNGHCKEREHRHQRGHGHCESHCDGEDSDHCRD